MIVSLNKKKYSKNIDWDKFFIDHTLQQTVRYDLSWTELFVILTTRKEFQILNDKLKKLVNQKKIIYPKPEYVFSAFMITPLTQLNVVILGQDPYFNCEYYKDKHVPQAMGLSFSVPHEMKIPSSLDYIYENLLKFHHLDKKPKSGNLWLWASQGCLMLNTALTVIDKEKMSNFMEWKWFTDYVIKYISENCENIIFVLWGRHAYQKINLINIAKHETIISSHPSGLSANKPMGSHPSFMEVDHFGKINELLVKYNKKKIIWVPN